MSSASTLQSGEVTSRQMSLVSLACTPGTAIEWFDFFLYGTMATLVFPALFFSESDQFVGTLLALLTFLIVFIARPFGGAVFGHLGDCIGRKSTLVSALLLMGLSMFIIGFLPGYATIDVVAPLILVLTLLFAQAQAQKRKASAPVAGAFRHNTPEILLSAGARFTGQAQFYLFSVFVITYHPRGDLVCIGTRTEGVVKS